MNPCSYKLSRSRFQRDRFIEQQPVSIGDVVVRWLGDLKAREHVAKGAVYESVSDAFYETRLRSKAASGLLFYEEYHPYGTTAYRATDSQTEVSAKRCRYTGKEKDEETGLYYHGARYYASWLGRWTAADPIGLGDGVNRFAYVSGNPVRLVDPGGDSWARVQLRPSHHAEAVRCCRRR